MLHEATLGALRDMDRLATAALREAATKKRTLVERDTIARVVEADARDRAQPDAPRAPPPGRPAGGASRGGVPAGARAWRPAFGGCELSRVVRFR